MRVFHIISSFRPIIGGAELATETLVRELRLIGIDAVVITRRYSVDLPRFEIANGVPIHRFGRPGHRKLNALTFALETLWFLAVHGRPYRLIHVQNIDTPMLIGIVARHILRRTVIATIHGEAMIHGRRNSRLGRLRVALMVRTVSAFTSINPANSAALMDVGVTSDAIHEIPNGIDLTRFRPPTSDERAAARSELGIPGECVAAVFVGRLEPIKRVGFLLDAWSQLERSKGARLVIVGGGSEGVHLQAREDAQDGNVLFVGATTDPLPFLWAADLFANASGDPTSGWTEGLSVALIEAMAVGVAPVVTRGPGNDVLVEDGVTGLSFPLSDHLGSLVGCLQTLIDDPEYRSSLGRNAAERVRRTYSAKAVATSTRALYETVAAGDTAVHP